MCIIDNTNREVMKILTKLSKIFVYFSFGIYCTTIKYSVIRKNKIIGGVSIEISHQSYHFAIISFIYHRFRCKKSDAQTNFDGNCCNESLRLQKGLF